MVPPRASCDGPPVPPRSTAHAAVLEKEAMSTSHCPRDRSLDRLCRYSARSILAALAIGLFTACSGPGDPVSGTATDTEAPDVDLDLAGTEPDAPGPSDSIPLDLLDTSPVAACPGGPSCPCKENPDCQIGLCIDDPAVVGGKACAGTCSGNCATGYACANVSGSGGDIQSICVPKFLHLCEPCAVSKDCEALGLKDSACIDQGELGRFCGVVCSSANDCPADYACQEVPSAEGEKLKQCARKPDGLKPFGACACSEFAVQKKLATACFVESKDASGQVVGKCAGQRTCTAAGLSACAAPEAKAEVCNGEDDDCDGQTDEASCDDGKPCTQDACDGKNGCQHKPLDGQSCDADGSVCTDGDACKEGVCVAGAKKDCDDKNPCTQDSCDMAKGCTHTDDDGKPCDADGSACTAGDVCQGSQCVKGVTVSCDDGNPCTVDKCDGKTGQCGITNEDDGIPCDDGTKCTSKDACSGGTCKGKAVSCDDDNPCTDDVCDKTSGCSPTPMTGSPCNDGNPCTVGDACKDGACDKGKPKVCDFSDTCKPAACDVLDGQCKFKNAKNGSACDDGSACTDKDACLDGTCDGAVLDCNDNNPCTTDSCDAKIGCASGVNSSPCSDGNACTQLDKCTGGKCVGQSVEVKVDCDDGNVCTTDSCDPKQGCLHAANLLPCDDGNPCSAGDQCGNNVCKPGSSTCACQSDADCAKQDDADLCNGLMFCDKAVSGQFACKTKPGSVIACDISLNTACSQQICDSSSGKCGAKSAVDGKACDADSSVCSEGDACAAGICLSGGKVDCDDKNPCTADSCDAKLGCVHAANSAPCDADGNACTLNDVCKDKVCMPGPKKSCDDGEFCTDDGCAKASGECLFAGLPKEGTQCDADASVCTVGDACSGGKCLSGKAKACDDGNPCTDDSCDAKQGCAYTPNQTPCDDGNACTKNDLCAASQCAGKSLNPPVDCDDGQVCTSDGCDPKVGCAHAANQQPCDDGNPCTQGDLCASKACQPGSNQCGCEKDADCASQEDGDLCNGTLFCDTAKLPYQCKVKATTIVQCDASKDTVCAVNVCTPATGKCGLVSGADGKDCDADGSVCTSADACAGGVCKAGSKVDCGDPNPCTTDTCDAKAGCQHVANTAPCDADGNACTLNDACQDKVCIADAKKVCDDGKACTVDSCDKTSGKCVVDAALQEGTSCDADGSVCTVGDACAQGACVAGPKKACDDSKACTDDSCDAKTGCVNVANVATCTDGDACTDKDICSGGSCVGNGVSCNDGNPCTDDSCDKAKGCVQLPNSVTCSDGNACTASDTCGSGTCAGAPVTCDDKDPCTADSCDAGKGCVAAALQEKADCSADGKMWCKSGTCVEKVFCFQPRVDLTGTGAPFGLTAADFDGDGDIDLAVAADYGNAIAIRMNDGTGKFPDEVTYPSPDGTRYVEAGDLNGDGKLDLVSTKFDGNTLRVFVNKGDGTFKAGVDYGTGGGPYDLRIGDLDGDGDNDVAVGSDAGHAIWVHWNTGTGNLSSTKSIDVTTISQWGATSPSGVALGDFNGDGKPDIACANTNGSNASVIINQGGGNFAQPVHLAVGAQPFAIEVADVSADGKLDLIVANRYSHDLSILLGDGAGGFGSQKKYATGQTPMWRMRVVDLDGDGDADVVVPNFLSNSVSILSNNGDGTFAAKKDYAVGSKPGTVVAADFDGNGAADFAVGSTADGVGGFKGISVFLGCGAQLLGTQAKPALSCKAILDAKASVGDGAYWLDPDGTGGVAPFQASCDMTTDGGGWTQLTNAVATTLVAGIDRNYLYSFSGRWYRSPTTKLVWSWSAGQELTGAYAWFNSSQSGTLTCNGSGEKGAYGISCSGGGGNSPKCITIVPKDPSAATATVCQDTPNAFGGPVCQAGVAIWVR